MTSERGASQDRQAFDHGVLEWLLAGDVAIAYQARRDLLGVDDRSLRERIATEGFGAQFLGARQVDGRWGRGFYQPKWTSSHYTLLDLKGLAIAPDNRLVRTSLELIVRTEKNGDGGVGPGRASDVCVNGMFLNYACYFGQPEADLVSIVDFILGQHMRDGGFNCMSNRAGATHSSLHSTLSVLEGFLEYSRGGYRHRRDEIKDAVDHAREFLLVHRLFRSDRTGAIIRPEFLKLTYPPRWKYNILRALDYLAQAGHPWDERLADAMAIIVSKRHTDGRWRLQAPQPGEVHFTMERPRAPSRWLTLSALRVLKAYGPNMAAVR